LENKTEKEIEFAFLVTQHVDGTYAAHLELPKEPLVTQRQATGADVLQMSQTLVKEIETQTLTERIVGTLVQLLQPPVEQPTVPEAVKEKLKERGINTDN
jgi:hypothetical protein